MGEDRSTFSNRVEIQEQVESVSSEIPDDSCSRVPASSMGLFSSQNSFKARQRAETFLFGVLLLAVAAGVGYCDFWIIKEFAFHYKFGVANFFGAGVGLIAAPIVAVFGLKGGVAAMLPPGNPFFFLLGMGAFAGMLYVIINTAKKYPTAYMGSVFLVVTVAGIVSAVMAISCMVRAFLDRDSKPEALNTSGDVLGEAESPLTLFR